MNRPTIMKSALVASMSLIVMGAFGQTDIRPEPGGKRLLFIEADGSVRPEPGGKRLLFIDGSTLRDEPGGKRLLFVDGDDVRPEAGGIRLAFIDGHDVRRAPGGKILINYRHPDLCPTAADKRIYFVDGAELSHAQLVAVLYLLKPELFKLTAEEEAALKKAMKEAGEEEEKRAAADHAPGKFQILSGSGRDGISGGNITIAPKKGEAYQVKFEHKAAPEAQGIGVQREIFGDRLMWIAFGPPKTVGLCVYEIKDGGVLEGKWYPWYYDGDGKNTGTENLKGAEGLNGEYKITAAKAPATGAEYTGTVTIKAAEIVGAIDDEKPYNVTWTFGDKKISGIGIKVKQFLFVCSGTGEDFYIANLKLDNTDGLIGDWFSNKNVMGFYSSNKMN